MQQRDNEPSVADKRSDRSKVLDLVVLSLIFSTLPRDAQAYIDPGSGALVVQAVLSGIFGLVFMARKTLHKIASRIFGSKAETSSDSHPAIHD